jgi:biofilm PGA synthesis N-glycosyltransferase PgaC
MISIVLAFFGVQFTISIVLYYGNQKSKHFIPLSQSENTTIIIPFKNENTRILPLLDSINKSAIANKKTNLLSHFQFIFIDDHSNDGTISTILSHLDITFQIIKLKQSKGKKYAIKKGVELAKFDRILTLDADVCFNTNYLDAISKTKCDGLTILPVNMDSMSIFQRLFSVEFWFLQRLTFGLSGFNKHTLCNGANLLFTADAFNKSLPIRQDANIESGDDVFLLNAVHQLQLPIYAFNNSDLIVNTTAPENIRKLIYQRKRWIKKMSDLPSILGGSFILVSNGLLIYSLFEICSGQFLYSIPIGFKIISELISVDGFRKKIITLFHQISYPFYLTILTLTLFGKNHEWRKEK